MAEYKVSLTQDEKSAIQNALIHMRYSSVVDDVLAETLDALIFEFQSLRPAPKLAYER